MRQCAWCGVYCDASIGISRELQTQYWGGGTGQKLEYSPRVVSFFCSDIHRSDYLAAGETGGVVQTDRWGKVDDDENQF